MYYSRYSKQQQRAYTRMQIKHAVGVIVTWGLMLGFVGFFWFSVCVLFSWNW